MRDNVVMRLRWRGDLDNAIAYAKRLDSLLLHDTATVRRGVLPTAPRISGLPSRAEGRRSSGLTLRPEAEGFGGSEVVIAVWGSSGIAQKLRDDGTVVVRTPSTPTTLSVWVVAGVPEDLLGIRKRIDVGVR